MAKVRYYNNSDWQVLDSKNADTVGGLAVTELAKTESYTATIPNTSWTGAVAPFTKTITVTGILSTDRPIVDIVASGTYATDVTMGENWGLVYRIVTSTNTITIYANEVPSASIPIVLKVVR